MTSTPPVPLLGRGTEVTAICARVGIGGDQVLEVEPGMGAESLCAAVTQRLVQNGLSVSDAHTALQGDGQPPEVIVDDLDGIDDRDFAELIRLRDHGAKLVFTRTPEHLLAQDDPRSRRVIPRDFEVIPIEPLTDEGVNVLIDEALEIGTLRVVPSSIERQWIAAAGSGFTDLVCSLINDVEVSASGTNPDPAPVSRRTVAVASRILAALPTSLTTLARTLLPLTGIAFHRLSHVVDAVDLTLLREAQIITVTDGLLSIATPIRAALRQGAASPLDNIARRAILDICMAVEVGANITESEIDLTATALVADDHLRNDVSASVQEEILSLAMWLTRRRGDLETAAVRARQLRSLLPHTSDPSLRAMARALPDDLESYTTLMRAVVPEDAPANIWVRGRCVQLPITGGNPAASDYARALAAVVPAADKHAAEALVQTTLAADALDRGDLDDALAIADSVIASEHAPRFAQLRAHVVRAAVQSERLDCPGVRDTATQVAQLGASAVIEESLSGDLDRRELLDALVHVELALVSAGTSIPPALRDLVSASLDRALRRDDALGVTGLTLCRFLEAGADNDLIEIMGLDRFMRALRGVDISGWAMALMLNPDTAGAERVGVGRRFVQSMECGLLLQVHARDELDVMRALLATSRTPEAALLDLLSRYLRAVDGLADASDVAAVSALKLDDGSISSTFRAVVIGAVTGNAEELRRAALALLTHGSAHHARAVVELATPLALGSKDTAAALRKLEREIRTRLSKPTEAVTLTLREREVSVLAAEGMSNRDIARTLFLSVRTVESHLYRAMRKFGVPREGLAAALALAGTDTTLPPR